MKPPMAAKKLNVRSVGVQPLQRKSMRNFCTELVRCSGWCRRRPVAVATTTCGSALSSDIELRSVVSERRLLLGLSLALGVESRDGTTGTGL